MGHWVGWMNTGAAAGSLAGRVGGWVGGVMGYLLALLAWEAISAADSGGNSTSMSL